MKKINEKISEWSIVLVLITIVTAALTVGKPVVSLTKELTEIRTELKTEVPALRKAMEDITSQNKDANDMLWKHVNTYTPQIQENSREIDRLGGRVTHLEKELEE